MSPYLAARAQTANRPAAAHTIDIRTINRHSETWYQAVCSCGQYRSGIKGYAGPAWAAGRDHANAKGHRR